MPSLFVICRYFGAISAIAWATAVPAAEETTTLDYAVMRNGDRIGASTVRVVRDGPQTIAEVSTHVQVKVAYITVYRFEQRETQRWANDRLLALNAVTDDNGTIHKVSARNSGDILSVDADGRITTVDPSVIPVSLWNPSLLGKTQALDPQSGKMTPVSVIDRGEEQLMLQGRATPVHHYSIKTNFAQDVWYDQHHRLVKVELHAIDGSEIQYRPG
jgi:hypothetical protein